MCDVEVSRKNLWLLRKWKSSKVQLLHFINLFGMFLHGESIWSACRMNMDEERAQMAMMTAAAAAAKAIAVATLRPLAAHLWSCSKWHRICNIYE